MRNSLSSYLQRTKMTQAELAERVGVSAATLNAWTTGHRLPSVGLAFALQTVTDGAVPASSWTLASRPDQRRQAKRPPSNGKRQATKVKGAA